MQYCRDGEHLKRAIRQLTQALLTFGTPNHACAQIHRPQITLHVRGRFPNVSKLQIRVERFERDTAATLQRRQPLLAGLPHTIGVAVHPLVALPPDGRVGIRVERSVRIGRQPVDAITGLDECSPVANGIEAGADAGRDGVPEPRRSTGANVCGVALNRPVGCSCAGRNRRKRS